MPEIDYRRVTRKKRSLAGYSQLWMAPDHLLLVNSHRFSENYQRFLLSDIQAISVTDGPDVLAIQLLAGLAAIGWILLAVYVNAVWAKWFFAVSGALFLALALVDIGRGPRCRCLLYTAVSQLRLRPVSRQRIAREFLAAVTPAIEAAQGHLAGKTPAAEPESSAAIAVPPLQTQRFSATQVLFGLYLLDALLVLLMSRFPQGGASLIFPLAVAGEILLAVVALAQSGSHLLRLANLIVVGGIAFGGYDLVILGRVVWRAALRGAIQGPTPPDFNAILAPAAHAVLVASVWRVVAGVSGLILFAVSGRRKSPA